MASNVRIVLNHSAVRELERGSAVQKELQKQGDAIAQRAGAGFEATYYQGRNRGRVTVEPKTPQAIAAQARNNVLKKALRG